MKSGLVFLGVIASVIAAGTMVEQPGDINQTVVSASIYGNSKKSAIEGNQWRLAVLGHSTQCKATFTVKDGSAGQYQVTSRAVDRCLSVFPDLEDLTRIETNENGDISLYNRDGSKLASFMESESSQHESFWPAHPLMTLARGE